MTNGRCFCSTPELGEGPALERHRSPSCTARIQKYGDGPWADRGQTVATGAKQLSSWIFFAWLATVVFLDINGFGPKVSDDEAL